ncbi:MAG: hypothetical protein HZB21_05255, partial [Deltaproteobacteria bacterium]|nr:hypothetical protein [Deltaproteobacteria bacterium]
MKIGIKIKLGIILSIVLFLTTSAMGVILIAHQRGALNEQMRSMAGTITDEFAHDSKIPLLQKDSLALNLLVRNILNYPGLNDAFILNDSMVIEGHKDLHEVGKRYDEREAVTKALGAPPWLVREDTDI